MKYCGARSGVCFRARRGWSGAPKIILVLSLVLLSAPNIQSPMVNGSTRSSSNSISNSSTNAESSPSSTDIMRRASGTYTSAPTTIGRHGSTNTINNSISTVNTWRSPRTTTTTTKTYSGRPAAWKLMTTLPSFDRDSERTTMISWSYEGSPNDMKLVTSIEGRDISFRSCRKKSVGYGDYHNIPLYYGGWYSNRRYGNNRECTCHNTKCSLELDVLPNTKYTFKVMTSGSTSQSTILVSKDMETGSGIPPQMDNVVETLKTRDIPMEMRGPEHSTIGIRIFTDRLDNSYGTIRQFQVILAKFNFLEPPTFGWLNDVQNNTYYRNFYKEEALYRILNPVSVSTGIFILGADQYENCKTCNGPLLADTAYEYKLRMYTTMGFADTREYIFKTKSYNVMTMVMVILVVLVVSIILVFVGQCVFRKFMPERAEHSPLDLGWLLDLQSLVHIRRPVHLSDLPITVNALLAHDQQALMQEYEELRSVCPAKPTTVALLPDNRAKNRYVNILPFDDSRVLLKELQNEPCSDYINASYLPEATISNTSDCSDEFETSDVIANGGPVSKEINLSRLL
ncbi:receptor-type tyrosine-protein phosphatase beta-like [Homarus americanus]|uniref:receptor-type tyrosine-protein phosphatase beta-like n=1 Tax=Homarus americanus TaxID=6706 RepID=UPI001C465C53|nr:receptor-type tyrosine-protein phosphatase beta-like [Homarus americanus]